MAPDFTLVLQPPTIALVPGAPAYLLVSVGSVGGFTAPVTLGVDGLPSGVTASFSQTTIVPPASVYLTLNASGSAATGQFELRVTGTGGGHSHTTSTSHVTVSFGLIPQCFGALAGRVTDVDTGLPISGAGVLAQGYANGGTVYFSAATDADGRYRIERLPVGLNNAPLGYSLSFSVTGQDYYPDSAYATVVCDAIANGDKALLMRRYGAVEGRVVVGIPDPNDFSTSRAVAATDTPIDGATITVWIATATSDAGGSYALSRLALGFQNSPAQHGAEVKRAGYWPLRTSVEVRANSTTTLNAALVEQCTATISGTVHRADTGQTMPGRAVNLQPMVSGPNSFQVSTDAAGAFTAEVLMGHNNARIEWFVSPVGGLDYYPPFGQRVPILRCGEEVTGVRLELDPMGSSYASIVGTVTDSLTGAPLAGATVAVGHPTGLFPTFYALTDASGRYAISAIRIGDAAVSRVAATVSVSFNRYYNGSVSVELVEDRTSTGDVALDPRRYGAVTGTVRDQVSRAPLSGASVAAGYFSTTTDAAGHFLISGLELPQGVNSQPYWLNASRSGYWFASTPFTLVADTTVTVDVDLLDVCDGATIVGSVVNALTLAPIPGAYVSGGSRFAITDSQGNFVLADIPVGNRNSPSQITVTASASGFNPQSKTVTVFCGATLVLEFGRPQTATGAIAGRVTNEDTGLPMAGVFIGSGFGGAATTNEAGEYLLANVPLGAGDAPRAWDITAAPEGFAPLTQSVTAIAGQTVTLDFTFRSAAPSPTPSPTPTATPSPTATPTATPTLTPTST
ncbi:MAG TPA: carboxypeptidase regulatory-like domain-containing protein, partial [Acidimicrobiales bacterium]|nr:carboxypeptidase regulatory-like domain-containing protein [Acidimicrobiales bacterium]